MKAYTEVDFLTLKTLGKSGSTSQRGGAASAPDCYVLSFLCPRVHPAVPQFQHPAILLRSWHCGPGGASFAYGPVNVTLSRRLGTVINQELGWGWELRNLKLVVRVRAHLLPVNECELYAHRKLLANNGI
jgi:hypothetical protein